MGWIRLVAWWILGILVHGAFLAGTAVTLLSLQNALAALLLAIVYLPLLAVGTRYMYGCEQAKLEATAATVSGGAPEETTTGTASDSDAVSADETTPASEGSTTNMGASSKKKQLLLSSQVPFYLSLWVALLNGWLAVPGLIAVFTFFPCGDNGSGSYIEQYVWRTNTTLLSSDVLEWMQHPHWRTPESFVTLADGTVYLAGSYDGSPEGLWSVYENEVQNLRYTNVHKVTALDEDEVCFVQTVEEKLANQRYGTYYGVGVETNPYAAWRIGCGNRTDGFRLARPTRPGKNRPTVMFNLHAIDRLLWFRQITDEYQYRDAQGRYCDFWTILQESRGGDQYCPWDSFAVYSFDPVTLEVTSYSQAVKIMPDPKLLNSGYATVTTMPVDAGDNLIFEDGSDAEWDEDVYEDHDENNAWVGDADADEKENYYADTEEEEDYYNENGEIEAVDVAYQEPEESIFCERGTMSRLRATGGLVLSALPGVATSARSWIKYGIPSSSVSLFLAIGLGFSFVWAYIDPWSLFEGLGIWVGFGTPVWTLISTYQLVVNPRISKEPLWWSLRVILTGMFGFVAIQAYNDPWLFQEMTFGIACSVFVHLPTLIIAILTRSRYFYALAWLGFVLISTAYCWDRQASAVAYVVAYAVIILASVAIYFTRGRLYDRFVKWLVACARHTCAIEAVEEGEAAEDEATTTGLLQTDNAHVV